MAVAQGSEPGIYSCNVHMYRNVRMYMAVTLLKNVDQSKVAGFQRVGFWHVAFWHESFRMAARVLFATRTV